jgi:hypothetical protein
VTRLPNRYANVTMSTDFPGSADDQLGVTIRSAGAMAGVHAEKLRQKRSNAAAGLGSSGRGAT